MKKAFGLILLAIMIGISLNGCSCMQKEQMVAMAEPAPAAQPQVVAQAPQPPPEQVLPPKVDRN